MRKISLPKPHIPTITLPKAGKTATLVVAGVTVVGAIFIAGAVQSVHQSHLQAAQAAADKKQHDSLVTQLNNLQTQNKSLESQVQLANAKAGSECDWIRGIAPKYRLAVPPLCLKS